MKKTLFIAVVLGFFFFGVINVEAFTLREAETDENVRVYDILAAPPQQSSALRLRVDVNGGEIVSFEQDLPGTFLIIPTCSGNLSYTESEICQDLALTDGYIQSGDLLARVSINITDENTFSINPAEDNAYLSVDNRLISNEGEDVTGERPESGEAVITVNQPVEERLENTFVYYLTTVLALGVVGAIAYFYLRNHKKS